MSAQLPIVSPESASAGLFTLRELKRVGTAAAMLTVLGIVVILGTMAVVGHYSSISHAFQKAVVDGLVIALLVGRTHRWRNLALLGAVYGFVLLAQLGVVYLAPVMMLAGGVAALVGLAISPASRVLAVIAAAATFELLAGFGAPIKTYLGTEGKSEPFLWALWFAEWPLRIAGAGLGAWFGIYRFRRHIMAGGMLPLAVSTTCNPETCSRGTCRRRSACERKGRLHAGMVLTLSLLAFVVPTSLQAWSYLGMVSAIYVVIGLVLGLRKQFVGIIAGIVWGWAIFAGFSYAWHHDLHRVIDLGRSFGLRFLPMAIAGALLVQTVRPLDLLRILRQLKLPGILLLPLAGVIRTIPTARQQISDGFARLKSRNIRVTPITLVRRPRELYNELLRPLLSLYSRELLRD